MTFTAYKSNYKPLVKIRNLVEFSTDFLILSPVVYRSDEFDTSFGRTTCTHDSPPLRFLQTGPELGIPTS